MGLSAVIRWRATRSTGTGEKRMGNPFVHVELATTDIGKAKSFYQSLFDWQLQDVTFGDGMIYTMIDVGEGTGGGMMTHPMPGAPAAWLAYTQVEDIAAATAKAKSLGATIVRDVTEVPDTGSLAIIQDPTGAYLGLWQPVAK
jgi:predicted enzyme related to lactoylglutathione lyase